jgi:hypothetical protein
MSRAHYDHWNEEADQMWWQEEGRFGHDLGTDEEIKQAVYDKMNDDYYDDHPAEGCE